MTIHSKLPAVGTTIFTVMSALAQQHEAINLGQGFPDFDCDPALVDAVAKAMRDGHNQYPPMTGVPALCEAIADKVERVHGHRPDASTEVTVTAGATQALLSALLAIVHRGDEVIVLEPAYDCYIPGILLAGGVPVVVPMSNDYRIDWDRIEQHLSARTRAIIINSPHNPTGTVLQEQDLAMLAELAEKHDLLVISDEVYEHMVFDGQIHRSMSADARLRSRSFVISSFGKTLHVTGWKIGYCIAPPAMSAEFRKVHQFNVFTVNTPMQVGLATYLHDPGAYLGLGSFYQQRRDHFLRGLQGTGFVAGACEGTYFVVCDYSAISNRDDADFARWLTTEIGVAAVPMSAFYRSADGASRIRFCFAKRESTLDQALERLARITRAD